ncbi:MAG TPA: hypothetical protein VMT38_08175 [Terracidiphilus sp.]|nr:hypothetical protein [Terracidiphilus sp.]
METLVESPRVPFVSGSNLPVSSLIPFRRLVVPCLAIAIGVSVGSATGLTLALVNASRSVVTASSDSFEADNTATAQPAMNSSAPTASLAMSSKPAVATQSATDVPMAIPEAPAANSVSKTTDARQLANVTPAATKPEPAAESSRNEIALNKTPDALKPATLKMNGKDFPVVRPAAGVKTPAAAKIEAQAPAAIPMEAETSLNPMELSMDAPAPAKLYTEGDLTVEDFNASTGTVETSDGKTFVLGTTVASANAATWESYRSEVHYRCDQNGSCMLMRAGVVAPDARLI